MNNSVDKPETNDNRFYSYAGHENEERKEYRYIVEMVGSNSKVIDLGCGNGVLLQQLIARKNIIATGMELSESAVNICHQKHLDVSRGRIDEVLPYQNNEFDYAICNVTIQMVMYPEVLLREMKRISTYQIISFPNFAFWKNRMDLLFYGRMPTPALFDYSWYTTGHIHQLSLKDFKNLVATIDGLKIIDIQFADTLSLFKSVLANIFPNAFHLIPIFLLKKE